MAKVSSILFALVAGLGLILGSSPAQACSCMAPGPACENFDTEILHMTDSDLENVKLRLKPTPPRR